MLELTWKSIGPARPRGAEVPPAVRFENYILAHDSKAGRTLYLCKVGKALETWSFDGTTWSKLDATEIQWGSEGKYVGGYDSARGALVVWRFGTEYLDEEGESERTGPIGAQLGADGLVKFATTGDIVLPKVKGSDQPKALFGFNPVRAVWVCLSRVGVWEMGTDDAWVQRSTEVPGVPPKWNKDGWGSAYDAARKALVFWLFDQDDDIYRFFTWDGAALSALPSDGLDPEELGKDPLALITVHPQHGLVLLMHDKGNFTLGAGQTAWHKQDALPLGPPLMKGGHMVWDPGLSAFVSGPGVHENAGSDMQRMFYKIGASTEMFGVRKEKSPIEQASYSNSKHAVWRGRWYAVSQSCLETWLWDDASGWSQIVDEDASKAVNWGWTPVTLLSTEAALLAVRGDGGVFAFDGSSWTDRGAEAPATFAKREEFAIAAQPDGTLVLWGGRVDGHLFNDSFVLEGKRWRQVGVPSRTPAADFKNIKNETFVDFVAAWDSKLGTVVRFGYADVALRMSEIWQRFAPPAYTELVGSRDRGHIPLHDPVSGETLLLDLEELRLSRFDVGGCTQVATVAAAPLLKKGSDEPLTWRDLHDTSVFDPGRLLFLAQDKGDRWGSFALDLAPAFAAARALGERTIPAPVPPPLPGATLYRVGAEGVQVWSYQVAGARLEISAGPLASPRTEVTELASPEAAAAEAARLEAARKTDGYRRALELSPEALRTLACVSSQKLSLVKEESEDEESEDDEDEEESDDDGDGEAEDASEPAPPPVVVGRLGGLPNGLAARRWPRSGDTPMGLLLQLETGDLVPGFAALAVFCVTDGTATEDEENNSAILLTAAELASPETPAPADVPVMPARAISIDPPLGELDETRIEPLIARDLSLATALDALQASHDGLQEGNLSDKRGGLPAWVQNAERGPEGFLLQLDFDRISLDETWSDAGLSGCIFVFVDKGEATAFWQYT